MEKKLAEGVLRNARKQPGSSFTKRRPKNASSQLTRSIIAALAVLVMVICSRSIYQNAGLETALSIPFLQEIFYFFVLMYASFRLFVVKNKRNFSINVTALGFVTLAILISALFSKFSFDQPLLYGIIEERRMLGILSLLLVYDLGAACTINERDIFRLLSISALIVFAISLYSQAELHNVLIGGRTGRFRTIGYFYALTFLTFSVVIFGYKWYRYLPIILASLVSVIFISQTRLIILDISLVLFLYLVMSSGKIKSLVLFGSLTAATAATSVIFLSGASEHFAIDTDSALVRAYSTSFFWDLYGENGYFMGIGALSLQWHDGFHRLASGIFKDHVFLSDLGLFGELVRYGIFFPVIFGFFAAIAYKCYPRSSLVGRKIFILCAAFVVLSSPMLGTFSMQGELIGLFLAICLLLDRAAQLRQADKH